jgi:leucyl/phenylalanyl-tRNA--protein transferase
MSQLLTLSFTPEGVVNAYRQGIFPMANSDTGEIDWYFPDPRAVIPLDGLRISKRLARTIRSDVFEVRYDTDFEGVMRACADRPDGTWISDDFVRLYSALHRRNFAHSVETWRDGNLVGGLYGVSVGGAFMGESMFHRETDASKLALVGLVERLRERGYSLLDTQFITPHLASLGAVEIPAGEYIDYLKVAVRRNCWFNG